MTPCYCVAYCTEKDYSLAGISNGGQESSKHLKWIECMNHSDCFCTDKLSKNVTEIQCRKDCPGDPSFKCGSHGYVSVYGTGL